MPIIDCATQKDIQTASVPSNENSLSNNTNVERELSTTYLPWMEEVRNVLDSDPFKALEMIDALQKLCITHIFKEEIDSCLNMLNAKASIAHVYRLDHSLYQICLYFGILRQEGYYVPSDVFANYKQKDGSFKREIANDVKLLMALNEASQLRIEGERILEDAADFSGNTLKEKLPFLDQDETTMVKCLLEHSYQRTPTTLMVNKFIKHYSGTAMAKLAKLELATSQSLHRTEVDQISRWWMNLGLAQELNLARNQPLKWYLWPMGSLTDPGLSEQRIELTKPIALIFILDDIFDVYGNLNELILLTEAVNRWDINTLEGLPYHIRICVQALYDVTHEISDRIYRNYGFNPVEYLRKTWINLCEAFLVEAKWFASGGIPKVEDYLKNGLVSAGAEVVTVHMFFLLGGGTDKETASIITDNPGITSCLAKILRLWDDLGSAKDENQDGHDGSYVTYYMNENEGCSVEMAQDHVMTMISNTWKQLNKECLTADQFPTTFRKACLNAARMIPLMYDFDENHSLPHLEGYINSMF